MIDVFILGFFKYYGFLSGAVNEWLGTGFSTSALSLPIGLSFYSFKNLSYIIDVYKKKCEPERDPIAFLAYASLFACMSAGPIVRYADIREDLYTHNVYMSRLGEGARRFILGLAKKVLLADQLSMMISQIQDAGTPMSMMTAWIYLFAYTMQISSIFPVTRIWQSGSARCLDLIFRRTLIIRILQKCDRVLEKVAHVVEFMVPGLCLYSAWGEPRICSRTSQKYSDCLVSDRNLARWNV